MSVRELISPVWEIEDDGDGLALTFRVDGSKFGPVRIFLTVLDADQLIGDLAAGIAFANSEVPVDVE